MKKVAFTGFLLTAIFSTANLASAAVLAPYTGADLRTETPARGVMIPIPGGQAGVEALHYLLDLTTKDTGEYTKEQRDFIKLVVDILVLQWREAVLSQ